MSIRALPATFQDAVNANAAANSSVSASMCCQRLGLVWFTLPHLPLANYSTFEANFSALVLRPEYVY